MRWSPRTSDPADEGCALGAPPREHSGRSPVAGTGRWPQTHRVLIVLSPAKTLDYESRPATRKHSEPLLLDDAERLIAVLATKTPDQIRALMELSPELAELNVERFQDWHRPFTPRNARAAILAFRGDVYLGMDAPATFSERDY